MRHFLKEKNFQKVLRFLSLRYSADFRRSRLVIFSHDKERFPTLLCLDAAPPPRSWPLLLGALAPGKKEGKGLTHQSGGTTPVTRASTLSKWKSSTSVTRDLSTLDRKNRFSSMITLDRRKGFSSMITLDRRKGFSSMITLDRRKGFSSDETIDLLLKTLETYL